MVIDDGIDFDLFKERLRAAKGVVTDSEIANALGVSQSAITKPKKAGRAPRSWLSKARGTSGINPDWLEFGREPKLLPGVAEGNGTWTKPQPWIARIELNDREIFVPVPEAHTVVGLALASSRLEQSPPEIWFAFPRLDPWLDEFGEPMESQLLPDSAMAKTMVDKHGWCREALAWVVATGREMEPAVGNGDHVLIDRNERRPLAGQMYAIAVRGLIVVRRYDLGGWRGEAHGSEIDSGETVKVIGRVVWRCRGEP